MPRRKSAVLKIRMFKSQKEATEFFREMLSRYRPKQRASDIDDADLATLLVRQAAHAKKVGIGIDHFEVMSAELGTQCFQLVRTDGTEEDFSYSHRIAAPQAGDSSQLR